MITRREIAILYAFAGWFTVHYSKPCIQRMMRDQMWVTVSPKANAAVVFHYKYMLDLWKKEVFEHFNFDSLPNTKANHRKVWTKYLDDKASLENVMKDFENLFLHVFLNALEQVKGTA